MRSHLPAAASACLLVVLAFPAAADWGVSPWRPVGQAGPSYVSGLFRDPARPEVLRALAGQSVFEAADGGATFRPAGDGLEGQYVYSLAADPSDPSVLYAGGAYAIFKSVDRGGTWCPSGAWSTRSLGAISMAVDPRDSSFVYSGTAFSGRPTRGFLRSTDGGATWAESNAGLPLGGYPYPSSQLPPAIHRVQVGPGGDLVLATTRGAFRSCDRGASWTLLLAEPGRVLLLPATAPETLFAGTYQRGVLRSTDAGTSWRALSGLPAGLGADVVALAGDPRGTVVYAALGDRSLWRSLDGGESWRRAATLAVSIDGLLVDEASPDRILAACQDGLYRSDDGGETFRRVGEGLGGGPSVIAFAGSSRIGGRLYAGTDFGIGVNEVFASTDGGETWERTAFGDRPAAADERGGFVLASAAADKQVVLAAAVFGLYRTGDGGQTWTRIVVGSEFDLVHDVVPLPSGGTFLVAMGSGLYKSTDGGRTFLPFGPASLDASRLAVAPSDPRTVYAVRSNLLKSTDGGETFRDLGWIGSSSALAVHPQDPDTLFFASGGVVARSTDGGHDWDGVLASTTPIRSLRFASGRLYAGSDAGLFASDDRGATWRPLGDGLPNPSVRAIAVDADRRRLLAGTPSGIFAMDLPPPRTLVPIVLDAVDRRGARLSTELVLTNVGRDPSDVVLTYTPANALGASGGGTVTQRLESGRQLAVPDAISFLREKGLPIPPVPSGPQGGTLQVEFGGLVPPVEAVAAARTTVRSGPGLAGVATPGLEPSAVTTQRVVLFGLRETPVEHTNLALVNAGTSPATLRVTLVPGAPGSASRIARDVSVGAGQWVQLDSVLKGTGIASGIAFVEPLEAGAPFAAYAVVNDTVTGDGSYVAATPAPGPSGPLVLPVVVKTPAYRTELVLANPGDDEVTVTFTYTESQAASGERPTVHDVLRPLEQRIVPDAFEYLRSLGAALDPSVPSRAGSLVATFRTPALFPAPGLVGARVLTPAPGGGAYGVFTAALPLAKAAVREAWVTGLRQDGSTRSNLGLVNPGLFGRPIELSIEIYDGETGVRIGLPEGIALAPGQWAQLGEVLALRGIANGYVRVVKTSGDERFVAYGVVNDGAAPGSGTGDGAFLPMSVRR